MSGHSKWSTIKRKKGVADVARGKVFTKLANAITVAAQKGGGDPESNPALRLAIEKARGENVPNNNIERAIKRGTGEIEGATLENFSYDVIGPGGVILLLDGVTDNKNRTLSELRTLLNRFQGKIAQSGSQRWQFKHVGLVDVGLGDLSGGQIEQLELAAIELGAQDVQQKDQSLKIISAAPDLKKITDQISQLIKEKFPSASVNSSSLEDLPSNPIVVSKEQATKISELVEALDESGEIRKVTTNLADQL